MEDKTWEITIKVTVTTLCGWKPDREDIEGMLASNDFELASVVNVKEVP